MSSSVCYLYFSPLIDKRQPICYAVILLWFLILISLFDMAVVICTWKCATTIRVSRMRMKINFECICQMHNDLNETEIQVYY